MPFYEYKCLKCEKVFEELQGINDEPLKICECGGDLIKLISTNAIAKKYGNSKEQLEEEIKPDAHYIAEKIKNGDENAAADIFGEGKMYQS